MIEVLGQLRAAILHRGLFARKGHRALIGTSQGEKGQGEHHDTRRLIRRRIPINPANEPTGWCWHPLGLSGRGMAAATHVPSKSPAVITLVSTPSQQCEPNV
jgi:hypothetical protein